MNDPNTGGVKNMSPIEANLVAFSPDPELTVAASARVCYSRRGVSELMAGLQVEEAYDLIRKLIRKRHLSPLEHVGFTFSAAVSRVCSHQLVRHRIASYSHQSQRYVSMDRAEWRLPPGIVADPGARDKCRELLEQARRVYTELIAMGIEREDARYLLPGAALSPIVFTMNARQLLHFFSVRCCRRAQWEIRDLAWSMLKKARSVAPVLFESAGPACARGSCSEGDMTCGRPKWWLEEGLSV